MQAGRMQAGWTRAGRLRDVSGRRRAGLSEADLALWAAYARLVVPMAGRALPALPEVPAGVVVPAEPATPAASVVLTRAVVGPAIVRTAPLVVGMQPPGVDHATWQKLCRGKLAATRTLDLHGRTAQRAFHALHAFLRTAHVDRQRVVEVITGRGSGEAGGVIRREFPLWLNLYELRPMVLAAAHPVPGPGLANVGSVRLLLRKPR